MVLRKMLNGNVLVLNQVKYFKDMEKQILKIVRDHYYNYDSTPEECAKEITAHVFEFIEWVGMNCFRYELTGEWQYIVSPMEDKFFNSTDELYLYWLENVKTK